MEIFKDTLYLDPSGNCLYIKRNITIVIVIVLKLREREGKEEGEEKSLKNFKLRFSEFQRSVSAHFFGNHSSVKVGSR